MIGLRGTRRLVAVLAATIALMGAMIAPASAVTDGEPDNDAHPYVGIMVAQSAVGEPLWACSGTLLSATLFLTAGHCTERPAFHIEIWFAPGPIPIGAGFPAPGPRPCTGITGFPCTGDGEGRPFTHPSYDPESFFLFDLGAVVLDSPMEMDVYGALPSVDQLDALKPSRHTTFTSVGYGLQKSFPPAADWKNVGDRTRMVARPHLIQINTGFTGDFSMLLSANANTGGTCFGDSGGPNFIGDTNVIAGVTSFGRNPTCAGTGGVYRVDRADDLDWLYGTFGDHLP